MTRILNVFFRLHVCHRDTIKLVFDVVFFFFFRNKKKYAAVIKQHMIGLVQKKT